MYAPITYSIATPLVGITRTSMIHLLTNKVVVSFSMEDMEILACAAR